jgi:hypothetical protein
MLFSLISPSRSSMCDEDQRDVEVVHRQHTPRIDDRGSPIPNFLSQLRLTDFSADFVNRIFDPLFWFVISMSITLATYALSLTYTLVVVS